MTAKETISVIYDVDPVDVCGGVFVDGRGFVKVTPNEEYRDDTAGISLWEYVDSNDDILACLMRVNGDMVSPRWHIKPEAGEGEYYERHQTVSGAGALILERAGVLTQEYTLPIADGAPIQVNPDDTFSIRPTNETPAADIYVLATFPQVPFKLEYEERV